MKDWPIICLLLGLVFSVSRAAGHNYLFDKFGPVGEGEQVANAIQFSAEGGTCSAIPQIVCGSV